MPPLSGLPDWCVYGVTFMYVCMCARACKSVRQVYVYVRVCCMCVCARARVCRARHRGLRSPSAATEAVVLYRDRGGGGSVV